MSEWQIELIGNEKDIKLLESLLLDSPYQITSLQNQKLLTLYGVSPKADIESVHTASDNLIDIINGVAKLYYKSFGGVSFTRVSRLDKNGKRIVYGYITANARDFTITAINPKDRTLLSWIEIAFANKEIARALYLYGSLEPNWKNLYMILEVIEDSFSGEVGLLKADLAPKKDIKLFKRTAQSYEAIGREARHGTLRFRKPRAPMSLANSQNLMSTLIREWIKFIGSQSA
jgi:hypothetical protein